MRSSLDWTRTPFSGGANLRLAYGLLKNADLWPDPLSRAKELSAEFHKVCPSLFAEIFGKFRIDK